MGLKNELEKIALEKQEKKKQLKKIKNRYLAIIYGGLSKRKSIKEIHKQLFDATINKKSPLLKQALIETVKIKKKVDNKKDTKYISNAYGVIDPLLMLSIAVFDEIKKNDVDIELNKQITKEVDKKENDGKLEALENAMNSGKVFFLASKHDDSAEDHEPYQGKLYFNENWMSEVDSEIAKKEIARFIDSHKLKSVQWVTDRPVYFITRPNCRHYFKEIPVREAIQTSTKDLLNRYGMHTPIGKRVYVQTLKTVKGRKLISDIRNAELVIEKYKERLQLFKAMYKEQPNPVIRNAINKTQLLIEKWSLALEKMSKK